MASKCHSISSLQFHLIELRHYIESRNLGQVDARSKEDKKTCKMLTVSAEENYIYWQHIFIEKSIHAATNMEMELPSLFVNK